VGHPDSGLFALGVASDYVVALKGRDFQSRR
jgi:hypothetical protein